MPILKQVDFEVPGFRELATPPISVPAYPDAVASLSPLGYWRLSETSGTTLADEAGAYPLSLVGNHTLGQPGAITNDANSAIFFFGGSANANTPILPASTNAPFSIAFWVRRPVGASGGAIMGQYTGNTTGHTRLHVTGPGTMRLTVINQIDFTSSTAVDSSWRFVVLTRSASGTLRWYIDGELDAELSETDSTITPINFLLGNPPGSQIDFYLDDVSIFDDALTASQARWLHGMGRAQLTLPPSL